MNSLILTAATRFLTPLILAFSVFLLLRGHNAPGGGFIGGLLAAIALCLYAKAEGVAAARAALQAGPEAVAMAGVGLALAAGLWGLAAGEGFLGGVWPLKEAGVAVGSILLFDTGVYLVVVGAVGALFFALESDAEDDAEEEPVEGEES
ncbi:MAG: MnhB domain-containing protein [Rubrimonas sp.]|uniref:MnhB domain-containing protein n=1 Tax=Rubrimonas sp. TaxID=2036015 RepID=UPI002FDD292F